MESATLISVDEYLSTTYKPACDYLDGVLRPKPTPTWNHSMIQSQILQLINLNFPGFRAGAEVSVLVRPNRYLVPDVVVQESRRVQSPYPEEPVYLCVEVLSPSDRLSDTIAKCEEYHAWGVRFVWIVDPEERRAWEFPQGQRLHEVRDSLAAGELAVGLADVFRLL